VWIGKLFDSSKPRRLDIQGHVYEALWSPVDDRIAIKVAPTALVDDSYMRTRIRVIDADGKELARLENPGKLGASRGAPTARPSR
jgi:hypothetical protein